MAILVKCNRCGSDFRAKDQARDMTLKCSNCGDPLRVDGAHVRDHDVFISYSHKDKAVADSVCTVMEGRKIRCWMAPRDIAPGSDWGSSIISAIEDSRVMVLVFSSNSNMSQQVLREVERAVAKGVQIVPVRLEEANLSKNLEYFLSACHWLDAHSAPLQDHLNKLAAHVKLMLLDNASSERIVGELDRLVPQHIAAEVGSSISTQKAVDPTKSEQKQPKKGFMRTVVQTTFAAAVFAAVLVIGIWVLLQMNGKTTAAKQWINSMLTPPSLSLANARESQNAVDIARYLPLHSKWIGITRRVINGSEDEREESWVVTKAEGNIAVAEQSTDGSTIVLTLKNEKIVVISAATSEGWHWSHIDISGELPKIGGQAALHVIGTDDTVDPGGRITGAVFHDIDLKLDPASVEVSASTKATSAPPVASDGPTDPSIATFMPLQSHWEGIYHGNDGRVVPATATVTEIKSDRAVVELHLSWGVYKMVFSIKNSKIALLSIDKLAQDTDVRTNLAISSDLPEVGSQPQLHFAGTFDDTEATGITTHRSVGFDLKMDQ